MEVFNVLNSGALNKICRTCLSEDIDLQSVFESSLNEMVMACSTVQIISGDGLPETICKQCIHQVNIAFKFKQLCEKSDYQLRNEVTQKESVTLEIKYEFEGIDNDSLGTEDDDDEKIEIKPDLDGVFSNSTETNVKNTDAYNESDSVFYNQHRTRNKQEKLKNRDRQKTSFASRRSKRISKQCLEDDSDDGTSVKSEDIVNECSLCNQTLSDTNQAIHEENYHQPGKHTCLACRKEFLELKLLKRHLRVHKLEKKHVCTTCGKGFYGANDLMIHTRVHTGEKPLECNVCTKTFSDPRGLNSHMKTHTGQKPYSCTVCNKSFAHSFVLSTHMRTHTAERPYVCSACGKTFVYAHNLAIHTRSHTGERPYHCTLCPKAFSSSSTLSAHMMTHTGEKRFVCSVCGKKVARSGDLAIHMRTHTGEKPYACSICPKRYRMSCHLTAHMKTHTGEKDHVCSVCSKAFADARVLKSHMTTHTGERPYSCHVCQKSFAHYSALSNHRKIHIDKKTVPVQEQTMPTYTSH